MTGQEIWILLLTILATGGILLWQAFTNSREFDGFFANGAFQLYNPLRRVHMGQQVGRDFQVFHGAGSALIHYPIFSLFGADLRASEIARHFLSPFFFVSSTLLFLYGASRSIAYASFVTILIFSLSPALLSATLGPENSLLGIRSTLPVFGACAILLSDRRAQLPLFALFCGLAIVISSEQGLAMLAAAVITGIVMLVNRRSPSLVIAAILAPGIASGVLLMLSGDAFGRLVSYNFHDVFLDQFWYFGAPPNPYAVEGMLMALAKPKVWLGIILIVICAGDAIRLLRLRPWSWREYAAFFLLTYGVITLGSLLGYIAYGNIEPMLKSSVLAVAALRAPAAFRFRRLDVLSAFVLAASIAFAGLVAESQPKFDGAAPTVQGVKLSPRWRTHLDAITERVGAQRSLWATYAGLVEAGFDKPQESPDYIIHALRPDGRERYLRSFEAARPEWVRTDNSCAWLYGPWLLNENWDFYRRIVTGYSLEYEDTLGVLWRRNAALNENAGAYRPLELDSGQCFEITGSTDELGEVQIEYVVENSLPLPVISNLPRYLLSPSYSEATPPLRVLPVSLPGHGYGGIWSFPVRLGKGMAVKFCPIVDPNPLGLASLTIRQAGYRTLDVDSRTLEYLNCDGKPAADLGSL